MSAPGQLPAGGQLETAPKAEAAGSKAQMDGPYGKRDGEITDVHTAMTKDRKCRDVFCCILFLVVAILGFGGVAFVAFYFGNPRSIVFPTDSRGNICGFVNGNVSLVSRPNAFYPLDSLIALNFSSGVCVASCPTAGSTVTDFYGASHSVLYNSTAVFYRCIPIPSSGNTNVTAAWYTTLFSNPTLLFNQAFADIYLTWYLILGCMGGAMLLSFLWICLMRCCAGCIVWLTIVLLFICLAVLDAFLFLTYFGVNLSSCNPLSSTFSVSGCYNSITTANYSTSSSNSTTMLVFACVLAALIVILFFVLLCMCSRICLAVAVIKEAANAVAAMPLIVFFPIWIFLGVAIYFVYWIVVLVFMAGTGVISAFGYSFDANANLRYIMLFMLFCLLWTIGFLLAIGQATIAGAIGQWYFTFEDAVTHKKELKGSPIMASLGRMLKYSMGSLAFGSLIIAIIQLVRIVLAFVERRLKGADNKCVQCLFKCLQCCLACFERFMAFLNRNAYIEIALFGYSFCVAAKTAFQLILRNILRMAAVSGISDLILFLGKLLIAGAAGVGCYLILIYLFPAVQLYPVIIVLSMLGAYIIASAFFSVYVMAIDTILLCFLEDVERHGDPKDATPGKQSYAPKGLQSFISSSKSGGGCCCC